MEKTKCFKKQKKFTFIILLILLFVISVVSIVLYYYLSELQREERLSKISDYTDYTISFESLNKCYDDERFTYDGYTYIYSCLDEVFLTYGTTVGTLEEIITSDYLTLTEFLKGMSKVTLDDKIVYTHNESDISIGYQVIVSENTVTISLL